MGRVKTPSLSASERSVLEAGFSEVNHCFRNRCHIILLKANDRSSKDVGLITGMSHISTNSWVTRFKSEGISGLPNKRARSQSLT